MMYSQPFSAPLCQMEPSSSVPSIVGLWENASASARHWVIVLPARSSVNKKGEPYYDYVRATVIDQDGKKAWTNPIFLEDDDLV